MRLLGWFEKKGPVDEVEVVNTESNIVVVVVQVESNDGLELEVAN